MPTPPTDATGVRRPDVRRPAGVSRAGLFTGLLATAGTLAVAFLGLGGPPAPAAPVALADATATATEPAATQVVVKTVFVQLPSHTAAPAAPAAPRATAAPTPAPRVVTRQSGSGGGEGGEGGEQEGND